MDAVHEKRRWISAMGKNQKIKIVIHTLEEGRETFPVSQAEEFWTEKIAAKLRGHHLTEQERRHLLEPAWPEVLDKRSDE